MDEDNKKEKAILYAQSGQKGFFERVRIADLIYYSKVTSLTIVIVTIIATLYYGYLNSLYLIDEVYEGTSLRELDLVEKMMTLKKVYENDITIINKDIIFNQLKIYYKNSSLDLIKN